MPRRGERATPFSSTLRQLADLAEIRGAVVDAADLRRAAAAMGALTKTEEAQLVRRAKRDRLDDPGISPTLRWRLRELAVGGDQLALDAARAGVPWLIRRLLELPALSTDQAAQMVRHLGILTYSDLDEALSGAAVRDLLGSAGDQRLKSANKALESEAPMMHLGRALDHVDALMTTIAEAGVPLDTMAAAGDARRFEPLVREIVLVASAPAPAAALEAIAVLPAFDDVLHRSAHRMILRHQSIEVDLRLAPPAEYGSLLFAATGTREHVHAVHIRRRAPSAWLATEAEVYRDADLPYIAPELRHATGEIEAAERDALPSLVDRAAIRGDLHMHSTWSDGRDTMEQMVATSAALGYEYIAITDHSARAGASRTVAVDQLWRQGDEIAALRERFPQIAILHGIEVDIMPDGSLDFDDPVLERLDIVLASLHDAARHDARTLTRRCLQAIGHPLVNVITHPANRLVGRRAGYALDFHAVYAAAAETGTALEIDGAPSHLDLDGEHARAAVAAGVTVTVDSDCHRAKALDRNMAMAIGTARRGWVEPRHVLNARPLGAVREFVAAKRRG